MYPSLELARRYYAQEIQVAAHMQSWPLINAFARVPREVFLGPGPWLICSGSGAPIPEYWKTPDADPQWVYHNVLIALDATRGLNNGHPSSLAMWIDALGLQAGMSVAHIGCGVGYYTAIMAEVVGSSGSVFGVEVDSNLASQAREHLAAWPQVRVENADGWELDPGPRDAIFVNAGVTHPHSTWLDRLKPGGSLLLPLTTQSGDNSGGVMTKVTAVPGGFAARVISTVAIFAMTSGRSEEYNQTLARSLTNRQWAQVQSLRRETHESCDSCWYHGADFCFSKSAPP